MKYKTMLLVVIASKYLYSRSGKLTHDRLRVHAYKEIEYFYKNKERIDYPWYDKYLVILYNVFLINLLARYFDKQIKKYVSVFDDKYETLCYGTYFALKHFNKNIQFFREEIRKEFYLKSVAEKAALKVEKYIKKFNPKIEDDGFIFSNSPIGIELEFSNIGLKAGKFFINESDVMENFSKYHYFHLLKHLWRFGAYIDSNYRIKQFIRKGGFLEYTFTSKDELFKESKPLTSSPRFASLLVREAVKFTPLKPHSIHVSLELKDEKSVVPLSFDLLKFLIMVTGDFGVRDGKIVETRIYDGDIKGIAVIRMRRNKGRFIPTVEFAHMRLRREFSRNDFYENAINMFIAYKNLFSFRIIDEFYKKLYQWALNPSFKDIDLEKNLEILKKGLDFEVALPVSYKYRIIQNIKKQYLKNKMVVDGK
ncbi:hypothetical protein FHQ18_08995 [Deferribacter autotrophicus]|uniref:Uncharacterized protein n=1 Tax=Deferribacter autotrophicus TaxID=500465 RepID=A0A5A8F3G4_9BACT|nr:hypothetical protein [Deferribacter autotrophicus]KAA0257867.1 hypothetical protein FHQ18_08995 [Deferribacter autotrophicus]